MRQFPLSQRHEELLNKAFGSGNWHEDKKLTGFSGAYVYQITYNNNPVVVKIAHPAVIQRERNGYHEFVLDNLHHRAPKLGDYHESDDRQEAILRYTYAGSVAHSHTLFEFLERSGQKAVKEAGTILDKMFTVQQSDRPKSWWERSAAKSIRCADYYDRWLPVQLIVEQLPMTVDRATLLHAGKLSQPDIAGLTAGQFVQLQGFQVEKEEAGVVTLYVGRPQAPSLRVKLVGTGGYAGELLPPTYAVIKETRKMLLEKYAEDAVGAFSMRSSDFTVDGHPYPNPLAYLDKLLGARYDACLATIHGDLNLRNILIEEKTPTAPNWLGKRINRLLDRKVYDWWLIDFASTQTGPVLLDLQWLEAQVINWLLVPALQRAGKSPHTLTQVLEALHKRQTRSFALRTTELKAAYSLLLEIRRLAESYLAEPQHNPDRWQEYYRGLTLALTATLKHASISTELGTQAKKFALVAAATTVRWAGVKLPPAPPPPWWARYGVFLLAGIIIGLIIYGGSAIKNSLIFPTATVTTAPTATLPTLSPTIDPTTTVVATPTRIPLSATPAMMPPAIAESHDRLVQVKNRGFLTCGINGALPLFSKRTDTATPDTEGFYDYDEEVGFDADFCKVVAIAIFGTYTDTVKFKEFGPTLERFTAIDQGAVDVLMRNTTWTVGRDGQLPVDFGPVYFYTEQTFMVREVSGIENLADLKDKKICVLPGTTTKASLAILRQREQIDFTEVMARNGIAFNNNDDLATAFFRDSRSCDAMTSDNAQLVAHLAPLSEAERKQYRILSPGIFEEPLAPVIPENDSQWREVVSYAVWATIQAEELGITRATVNKFDAKADLKIQWLLSLDDDPNLIGDSVGEQLGLKADFAHTIIEQMGNYREIYNRHFDGILDPGLNQRWPAGRLFAPPFAPQELPPTPTPIPTPTPTQTPDQKAMLTRVAIDL